MAPLRKSNVLRERRARSRSPATRTRLQHTSSLTSRDQRVPIDCPLPRCKASTVHYHGTNPQFYNPHRENEVRHRGYIGSRRDMHSQTKAASGVPAMGGLDMFDSGTSGENGPAKEQVSRTADEEAGIQERPISPLVVTLKAPISEEVNSAQESVPSADIPGNQKDGPMHDAAAPEEVTIMKEGISSPTHEANISQRLVSPADLSKEQQNGLIHDSTVSEEVITTNEGILSPIEEVDSTQKSGSPVDFPSEQQNGLMHDAAAPEDVTMMDEGIFIRLLGIQLLVGTLWTLSKT